jgi:TonB-linked SusC/RagA family outer membrane protein
MVGTYCDIITRGESLMSYQYAGTTFLQRRAGFTKFMGVAICLPMTFGHAQQVHPVSALVPDNIASQESVSSSPLSRTATLTLNDVPLREALRVLGTNAAVKLTFGSDVSSIAKSVTLQVKQKKVEEVLNLILTGTGVQYRVTETQQILLFRTQSGAQGRAVSEKITGRVTDSTTGKGISGVTVTIQEQKKFSAITNDRGEFVLTDVPEGEWILTFKLLGYSSVTRTVRVTSGQSPQIHVALQATPTTLSGVVTTATGQQRKLEIGNAITTINVDSIMQVAPISSLTDILETRVPGLMIQNTSGTPGDPSRTRLRGAASINGNNDPIVIVDGVRMYAAQSDARNANAAPSAEGTYAAPSPLDQIDPNIIETINVFKGPSASAMYGSDAANGVIVITTKRGRGGPARWNAAANYGVSYLPGRYPMGLYRFGTFAGANLSIPSCNIYTLNCQLDSIVSFQGLNERRYTVLGTGNLSGVTTTVSGGTQNLLYSMTGSASSELGLFKLSEAMLERYRETRGTEPPGWMRRPDRYNTWGARVGLTSQVNAVFNASVSSDLFKSEQRRSSLGLNSLPRLMSTYLRPLNPSNFFSEYDQFYERVTSGSLSSRNTLQVNWQAFPWLPITMMGGINTITRRDEALMPRGMKLSTNDSIGHFGTGQATTLMRTFDVHTNVRTLRNQLTMAVGMNYVNESITDLQAELEGLPPGIDVPTIGMTARQSTRGRTTFGWFAEPRLNINSRFFVMPGFRLDNNGLAGSSARLMGLPKMNFSWITSDEPFFPWKNTVSLLRLRFGGGTAGVQPGPADRLRLMTIDTTVNYSPLYQGGAVLSTLGNTKLRPERSTELEGGFDIELWQGRLVGELTTYRKTRYDAIVALPLPLSVTPGSAEPSVMANIGVVRNTGTELSLNAQVFERSEFSWNIGLNVSQNANVVVRLNAGQEPITLVNSLGETGAFTRILPGYPLWGRWARPILSYGDANGNNVIEKNEVVVGDSVVYLGQQDPKITTAFNTNMTFLNGRIGVYATFNYTGGTTQFNSAMNDRYSPFNLAANDPTASFAQQAAAVAETPYGRIQTVNMLRFHSLAINYNMSPSIARMFHARRMAISLQGENLGLRTNYQGKDPNVNSQVTGNLTIDGGALPNPRKWTLRMTLGN